MLKLLLNFLSLVIYEDVHISSHMPDVVVFFFSFLGSVNHIFLSAAQQQSLVLLRMRSAAPPLRVWVRTKAQRGVAA